MINNHRIDPFGQEFLQLLLQVTAPGTTSRRTGPTNKRRKTESTEEKPTPTVDSVTIWQHKIVTQRPSSGIIPSASLPNLQSALKFTLGPSLTVATKSSAEIGPFCVSFVPDNSLSFPGQVVDLLNQHSSLWSNPSVEDTCWIACDGELSADETTTILGLTFRLLWNVSTTIYAPKLGTHQRKFRQEALALAFPDMFSTADKKTNSCSPQVFYEAAHVPDPDPDHTPPETAIIPGLASQLYPFQRRAVKWLMKREGVEWTLDDRGNSVTEEIKFEPLEEPRSFIRMDVLGSSVYINPVLGKVTKDPTHFREAGQDFKGGILSEEMGLGKTVELVALLSLHPQPPGPDTVFDYYLGEEMKTTAATLIVAPSPLREQWIEEIAKHAPGLRVMHYKGLTASSREETSKANALVEKLRSHDVVITTYNILTQELDYALGEPNRARRAPRKYHRPRSPLTQLRWWRVCMDEAQMIESGVSKSATLARLLPRVNAWGVTGTPCKDSVEGKCPLCAILPGMTLDCVDRTQPAWKFPKQLFLSLEIACIDSHPPRSSRTAPFPTIRTLCIQYQRLEYPDPVT